MGEIYKVTNKLNGKVYIGKTTCNMATRKKDHISKSLRKVNNIRFHNAIRFYGPDNFYWEVIEDCADDLLDSKEIYYINLYNANNKYFGYNMTEGGDNDPKCNLGRKRSIDSILKTANGLRGQKRSKEARLRMSIAQKKRFGTLDKLKFKKSKVIKEVFQFDLSGVLVKKWPSAKVASEFVNVDVSNIIRACTNRSKTSAGYIWRYDSSEIDYQFLSSIHNSKKLTDSHRKNISKGRRKLVAQYTLDGLLVKTWEGCDVAAKELSICKSGIIRCCRGTLKKSGGFVWRYL